MFFEINNKIFDSCKLKNKRAYARRKIYDLVKEDTSGNLSTLSDELFYFEDELLIVDLRIINLEDYIQTNFSF